MTADDQRFVMVMPNINLLSVGEAVYSREWYWSDEVQARLRD
ncbi:hypothetical protein ACFL3S_04885 [Gemmatimonadota bacterium]